MYSVRGTAQVAGAASGLFEGLVGNQGGIRSAAMLGFDLAPDEFVGTAIAVALLVDLGRLPVYLAAEWITPRGAITWTLIASAGVVIGTLAGLSAQVDEALPRARTR